MFGGDGAEWRGVEPAPVIDSCPSGTELGPSLEYYRVSTARPPFTYAALIRWVSDSLEPRPHFIPLS